MPHRHRGQDSAPRAIAKLADLAARGKCAPPGVTSATMTGGERQRIPTSAIGARTAAGSDPAVAVVVPAWLSLDELCASSGAGSLLEVTLSLPVMEVPATPRAPAARDHRLADATAAGGEGGSCAAFDSAFGTGSEASERPNGSADPAVGLATTAAAAVAAAMAAMAGQGLDRPPSVVVSGSAAAAAGESSLRSATARQRSKPLGAPPGFATAAAISGIVGSAVATDPSRGAGEPSYAVADAPAASSPPSLQPSPVPLAGKALAPGIPVPATPEKHHHQHQYHPPTPLTSMPVDCSTPAVAPTASTNSVAGSLVGATGTAPAGAAPSPQHPQQHRVGPSPRPPHTPPLQSPAQLIPADSQPSLAASSSSAGAAAKGAPAAPRQPLQAATLQPPPVLQGNGYTWGHGYLAGFVMNPIGALAYGGVAVTGQPSGYGYYFPAACDPNGYGADAGVVHRPMLYTPHGAETMPYALTEGWGGQQLQPVSHPHGQQRQGQTQPQGPQPAQRTQPQPQPLGQGQMARQPSASASRPPRPPRPPERPQSLAPVSALFGSARKGAVKDTLRRTLVSTFLRDPELFRTVYGFDLASWASLRGKPVGEDDLLEVIPFKDYVAVVVHVGGGAAPALEAAGRRPVTNSIMTALLGRPLYGNALLLRLRMDFACATDEAVEGLMDRLHPVRLTAGSLRDTLLGSETLAWYADQYREFLEDIDECLEADVHVGWVARLPRTPLDSKGEPDSEAAARILGDMLGLTPQAWHRAQRLAAGEPDSSAGADRDGEKEPGPGESGVCGGEAGEGGTGFRGAVGAVLGPLPAALTPLLRCLRCSSPWCRMKTTKGAATAHGDSGGCPFGHVWRMLSPEDTGRQPIFNAARPAALAAAAGAVAASGGSGSAATRAGQQLPAMAEPLQPAPCYSLTARLSPDWPWYKSRTLSLMVLPVLEASIAATEAAEARAAALDALQGPVADAPDEDSISERSSTGTHSANGVPVSSSAGEEDSPRGSVSGAASGVGSEGSSPSSTEGGKGEEVGQGSSLAEEALEARWRRASAMLKLEDWPYYLSFCKGPECRQCHSCHELRVAAAVERLLPRVPSSASSASCGRQVGSRLLALGASAGPGAAGNVRPGFEVLAQYDGDPSSIEQLLQAELRSGGGPGGGKVGKDKKGKSAGEGEGAHATAPGATSGVAAAAGWRSGRETADSCASADPAARLAGPLAAGAASGTGTASTSTTTSEDDAAAAWGGEHGGTKLNWADEAEAEAEAATEAEVARTAVAKALARRTLGQPVQAAELTPMLRPSPPPGPAALSEEWSFRAPLVCAAALSGTQSRSFDLRPLPNLPDHLDDEDGGWMTKLPPLVRLGGAAASAAAAATVGDRTEATPAATAPPPQPDRTAVTASMASKSRNGVYVPPHLRNGIVAQKEEGEVEGRAPVAVELESAGKALVAGCEYGVMEAALDGGGGGGASCQDQDQNQDQGTADLTLPLQPTLPSDSPEPQQQQHEQQQSLGQLHEQLEFGEEEQAGSIPIPVPAIPASSQQQPTARGGQPPPPQNHLQHIEHQQYYDQHHQYHHPQFFMLPSQGFSATFPQVQPQGALAPDHSDNVSSVRGPLPYGDARHLTHLLQDTEEPQDSGAAQGNEDYVSSLFSLLCPPHNAEASKLAKPGTAGQQPTVISHGCAELPGTHAIGPAPLGGGNPWSSLPGVMPTNGLHGHAPPGAHHQFLEALPLPLTGPAPDPYCMESQFGHPYHPFPHGHFPVAGPAGLGGGGGAALASSQAPYDTGRVPRAVGLSGAWLQLQQPQQPFQQQQPFS